MASRRLEIFGAGGSVRPADEVSDQNEHEADRSDGAAAEAERGTNIRLRYPSGEGGSRDTDGHHGKAVIGTRQPMQEAGLQGSMTWMGDGGGCDGGERSEGR